MAEQTKSRQSRSAGSRKPGRRRKNGGGSNKGGSNGSEDGGNMSKAEEAQTGGKAMGRPPADEPDVYVDVPEVHVGELNIDVEQLQAHLALRAQVANLVNLAAGVQLSVDKVKIDLKDVDAKAELKVRLENTYNILDRTLTTLDENPEIVKGLLETADTAVQETGQIGEKATQPEGAVSQLSSGVGDTLGNIGSAVGNAVSTVTDKANPKQLMSGGNGSSSKQSGGGSKNAGLVKGAGAAGAAGLLGAAVGWYGTHGRNGGLRPKFLR
jgi:hypothetical protein